MKRRHIGIKHLLALIISAVILFTVGFIHADEPAEPAAKKAPAPNIALSAEKWDFGTIIQGEVATHIFEIKNTGESELTIYNVRTSCGCTAVLLSSNNIPPSKSAELKVTFASSGYTGNFEKSVYLNSNDPDESYKTIVISGNIKVLPKIGISVKPDYWSLAPVVSDGQEMPFQFSIENKGESNLKVSSIGASTDLIYVSESSAEIKPNDIKIIEIKLDPKTKTVKSEGQHIYLKIEIPVSTLQ